MTILTLCVLQISCWTINMPLKCGTFIQLFTHFLVIWYTLGRDSVIG